MTDLRLIPNAPIDAVHTESLAAVDVLRAQFAEVRHRVARWEPTPTPRAFR